jgi:glutathione peroxidase
MPTSVHDFSATDVRGNTVELDQFRGQVLLIVNTASGCGFTPQLAGLEALHQRFAAQGLVVLGFPCNQFGGQEPGTNAQIAEFCGLNFGVSFPLMGKVQVNGPEALPLYQWLSRAAPGILGSKGIKWNFTKFLVERNGTTVRRFAPQDTPASLTQAIEQALAG